MKEIKIPDLGNITEAEIIEIAVKPGDTINKEDTLITLESDKASMDIPSPENGKVKEIKVKKGDKVKTGSLILTMEVSEDKAQEAEKTEDKKTEVKKEEKEKPSLQKIEKEPEKSKLSSSETDFSDEDETEEEDIHAGPGVRRLAREFGIDLTKVQSTGRKGRILKEDLQSFVKNALEKTGSGVAGFPNPPIVDFTQFGETESQPLSRIKRLTAINLHRNWVLVPHVTQFDEADITDLEVFRKETQETAAKQGIKLTLLAFIMKAVVTTLKAFPTFNASLDVSDENLILKKYFHLGVAVDTPQGLVVPVIRDVDQKELFDLAKELGEVSSKAREKALTPADMQGSSFTISSLGGIGGSAFTPIVNLPDVAILGVSKATIKPMYHEGEFIPRLMLPLSLSYDHRVIDGAEGARFIVHLASVLTDMKRCLL